MAGKVLRLISKRTYNPPLSTVRILPVVERIDISEYINAILQIRIHAINWTNTGNMAFGLWGDGFTENDPGISFLRMFSGGFCGTVGITSATTAPSLISMGGTAYGKYAVLGINQNIGAAGTASVTVSVDVILRCPDDPMLPYGT